MIVANNVKVKGAGFGTDTNVVTIITKDNEETLPIMTKEQVAEKLLDRIVEKYSKNVEKTRKIKYYSFKEYLQKTIVLSLLSNIMNNYGLFRKQYLF